MHMFGAFLFACNIKINAINKKRFSKSNGLIGLITKVMQYDSATLNIQLNTYIFKCS